MNNGYYPFPIRQGSKKDFIGAWIMRILGTVLAAAIIWLCGLILSAVMYLVNTLPPMQSDVSQLKTDVTDLKENAISKKDFNRILEAKLKEFKVNKEGRLIVVP